MRAAAVCFGTAQRAFKLARILDGVGFRLVPPDPIRIVPEREVRR